MDDQVAVNQLSTSCQNLSPSFNVRHRKFQRLLPKRNSSVKMASYISNTEEITGPNTVNRHLLQNQTFLQKENETLQHDVTRLSRQLENLRMASVSPELFQTLKKEKDHLLALNDTLRKKIKHMKNPSMHSDTQKETQEKLELIRTVQELDRLLEKIKRSEKFEVKPCENETAKVIEALTKKIDEEQRKNEEAAEALRKLREDDEKYVLREKLTDMKQLVTDLEVENTKLRFENEQLVEDVENYKRQLNEATDEARIATKKFYELEDEKDKLKKVISDLEDEKIKLKKEMIEEMNEANRAKRVSVDTEIALHHISEAYENKRKEVQALNTQLDDAEKIIREFKNQFEPVY